MASIPNQSPESRIATLEAEVARLRGLWDGLLLAMGNDAREQATASYTDPAVLRIQARRRRIAASGLRAVR